MRLAYGDNMEKTHKPVTAADIHETGVSMAFSYQLVSGLRRPSLELALKLEDALGVSPRAWGNPPILAPIPVPVKRGRRVSA